MGCKVINLEQGSAEWLKKRTSLVTGTDVAKILGTEAAKIDLAQAKFEERRTPQTRAMRDGNRFEPLALKWLSKKEKKVFSPVVLEDTSFPILVSLDGADFSLQETVEIKVPDDGEFSKTWKNAEKGVVDEEYYIQIQAGLMVSGASHCYYVVFNKRTMDGIYLKVKPDLDLWEDIKKAAVSFYDEYMASDAEGVKKRPIKVDSKEFMEMSMRYKMLKEHEADLKREVDLLKEQMLEHVYGDGVYENEHLKITISPKKGVIDKDEVIKVMLGNVNLERFRKEVEPDAKDISFRIVKPKAAGKNKAA